MHLYPFGYRNSMWYNRSFNFRFPLLLCLAYWITRAKI